MAKWTFVTNHAVVLSFVAKNQQITAREMADVEGGGKLRQLAARNCDTEFISDPLSIFLSIENLCFSASSSDWQRRRFFLPPGLAQTVALPVGLYDVTPVGQAV